MMAAATAGVVVVIGGLFLLRVLRVRRYRRTEA
jgi:hypothetical protein